MTKPKLYRLCFDFTSYDSILDFWDSFVKANLEPDGNDWRTCGLVHRDALHDNKYSVQEILVRSQADGAGNGRPLNHATIPEQRIPNQPGVTSK